VKITDSTSSTQPSVELHIEELILHGFASGNRFAVGDAVERELARLFGEQGIPVALRSQSATDEMTGAVFNSAQNAKPRGIGRQIAQAVYQGFGK
jgi:hypothetical protein